MVTESENQRVTRITGERLQAAREKAGLTVVEVAAIIGCRHNDITVYERGVRAPSQTRLNELRKILRIKRWDII